MAGNQLWILSKPIKISSCILRSKTQNNKQKGKKEEIDSKTFLRTEDFFKDDIIKGIDKE